MSSGIIQSIKDKLRSGLGKDILITLVAQLTIMVLALIVNKMLSVKLGVDGYGQYSIIKKSTQVLSFVMLSGMGIAIPRYLATYIAKNDKRRAKSTVVASLLVIFLVSLGVITPCLLLFNALSPIISGGGSVYLYLSALVYACSITACSWLYAYYRGTNAFLNFGVSQVVVQVLVVLGALLFGGNLLYVLNSWSATTLLYVGVSLLWERSSNTWLKGQLVTWNDAVGAQFKTLLTYGLPRTVGDFFYFSFVAFPLVYINGTLGINASSFFATGLMLTSMVTPLFGFLGMVLLPYVSTAVAKNTFLQADRLIKQLTVVYILLSLMAIGVMWFGMDVLIRLFFSTEFLPAAGVAKILSLTVIFESIYLLLRNPIDAISVFPYNTINVLVCLILLLVLFYFSSNLEMYALSFLGVTAVKSAISWLTWGLLRKKIDE